jgi:peptidoglycan-associated lipoprotein
MRFKLLSVIALSMLAVACSDKPKDSAAVDNNSQVVTPPGGGGSTTTTAITPGSLADFQKNVGDRIFFDYDKSDLSPDARATLSRQAAWLKQFHVSLVVEGHCDERGTREYNLALGERRANAVKNFLVAQGVPASGLSTISYGKERPAVPGDNEAAWAQNRRGVSVPQNVPAS